MATAYVARFTRRILGVVGQESRAASPGLFGMSNGDGPPESDFMAELVRWSQRHMRDATRVLSDAEASGTIPANAR